MDLENIQSFLNVKDAGPWVVWAVMLLLAVGFVSHLAKEVAKVTRIDSDEPKELRHVIAYVFVAGGAVMLVNAVVLFNMYAFSYSEGRIGFWPGFGLFVGSVISTGIAAIARYGR